MEFRTHWKFDDFYPEAPLLRQLIDEHFTESIAGKLNFDKRALWNYWFIPTQYTYLRANPHVLFTPERHDAFLYYLKAFAARQFGLFIPTNPFISMYVNGCGQNIHNDYGNGRLAYVFSLTKWEERHFLGGETFIYTNGESAHEKLFRSTGGWGWYDYVEPVFNRLALFDDRLPHAVNPIQGSMDPKDARFVMHGHMEESPAIAYIEGGLQGSDLRPLFDQVRISASRMFQSHGLDGFVSIELPVEASGAGGQAEIKCMQLLPLNRQSKDVSLGLADIREILSKITWPTTANPSKLVFALGAAPLR